MKTFITTLFSISLLSGCAYQAGVLDRSSGGDITHDHSKQAMSFDGTPAPQDTQSAAANASAVAGKMMSPLK